ncbi:MAG: hypothetical protein WCU88_09790 [Elusimicrobiota bacterium]|jgi:DNA-directed RNA polymerase specialized sigma24 family protein
MAPETTAVSAVAAPAAEKEAVLAENIGAPVEPAVADPSRKQILSSLLERLHELRRERCRWEAANPWEEYAAGYVEKALRETERREEIAGFIDANHRDALQFALRVTQNCQLAEQVVSETYIELLTDKTSIHYFFRALKMNARNLLEARNVAQARFKSLEALAAPNKERLTCPDGEAEETVTGVDFPSHRQDDQDPLEILIKREETSLYSGLVKAAMADPRWRYIKRRDWARSL